MKLFVGKKTPFLAALGLLISNTDAREYGTAVYLCENPLISFNQFWSDRLKRLE